MHVIPARVRARSTSAPRVTRVTALAAVLATVTALAAGVGAPAADAVGTGVAGSTVVSTVPSTASPNITNGTVYAITQVGSQIIVGGSFTTVQNHGSSTTMTRTDVLAFDAATGTVSTGFAPTLDGTVEALTPGPAANTVYVGGQFKTVNGAKAKAVTLLDLTSGSIVGGFTPPVLNGVVNTTALVNGHLLLGGTFTVAGSATRQGLASLNPTTGALDSYLTVGVLGHHGYTGSGTKLGAVGPRALSVNPAGTRAVVIGNFTTANGLARNQIVVLDLGPTSAGIDTWATGQFTAACYSNVYDSYVTDVQFSADGSYFVVTATGGNGTNSDGSRSLCDSASRWDAASTSASAMPTWVDYTGNDTLWSVTTTTAAIYVGGHERWLNNSNGTDYAAAGAVARPGVAALDPASGVPLSWNPGRNPRGAGAYALFVSTSGLYVGSDTDYIGDFAYERQKIAFFPLAGGAAPASTATATLPSNVYAAGYPNSTTPTGPVDTLSYRPVSGTRVGSSTTVPTSGIAWDSTRGAFAVGNTVFYGTADGHFYRAAFDGTAIGTPTLVDPYDDPAWDGVKTGSGQTYQGVATGYYAQLAGVTGAFYSTGRLYYSLQGQSGLYWRWFSPDSGVVGSQQFTATGGTFTGVAGLFVSGSTLYYASSTDGSLHAESFAGGVVDPTTDTVVDSSNDWRARGLFLYGPPTFPGGASGASVGFVAQARSNATSAAPSVVVPAGVDAGDTELLFLSTGAAGVTTSAPTGLAGWQQIARRTNSPLETTVFERIAGAGEAGTRVTVPLTASTTTDLQFLDYSGVSSAAPVLATAADSNVSAHVTPAVPVTAAGSWVVSYWSDRGSSASNWTLPAPVTARGSGVATGGGHVDAAVADSGAVVAPGTYGGLSATTGAVSGKGAMVSLVLTPSS